MTEAGMPDPMAAEWAGEREPGAGTPAGPGELDRPLLHSLLLGMAGRVSDDALATMRACAADWENDEVASILATEVAGEGLAVTRSEARLIQTLFVQNHIDPGLADRAPRVEQPPCPFRFSGDGERPAGGGDLLPALPTVLPPEVRDATDSAVVEAADRVGGLAGLWRVFRHSGDGAVRRVYLAEAEPAADATELVAEMQYAATEASADTPRVEVFYEGGRLTPYHSAALAAAALVWGATETPLRLARVFDGADPVTGPFFHPRHPRLEGPDGERVLAYLRGAELVLNTPGAMDDVLDTSRRASVPAEFRSDGRWVWPDSVAYYLEHHRLAPEPELIAHALAAPPQARPLCRLGRHRVLAALFDPTGMEPM